jgi:hypothetical protein
MYLHEAIECVLRLDCSLEYHNTQYHIGYINQGQRILVDNDDHPVLLSIEKLSSNEWGLTQESALSRKVAREVTSCHSCINHKPRRRPRG